MSLYPVYYFNVANGNASIEPLAIADYPFHIRCACVRVGIKQSSYKRGLAVERVFKMPL